MSFRHGVSTIAGIACLLALFPAGSQAAARRVVIAYVPGATLAGLRALPGASVGLLSATQGKYRREQALLDVGQGSRTSLSAYDPVEPRRVRVQPGRIAGWDAIVRRADAAPAEVVPGLLASSVPGGAAFTGRRRLEAISAADRRGRFSTAPGGRVLVVTVTRDLRQLVARRDRDTLVLAVRAPPRSERRAQLLPAAAFGLGAGRQLTSSTTRTDGLVTGTDLAATALRWLGRPIPGAMQGQPLRLDGPIDVGGLHRFEARLRVVSSRRLPTLGLLALEWLLLAALLRSRRAVRIGCLAVLWVLPVLLGFAALQPSRLVEEVGVGLAALALAAATDALVPWPRAPVVPAAIGIAAYVIDLAAGSPLIVRSLFGPNPLFGARFYGVGNELEATLPVLLFAGIAAALGPGGRTRGAALAFAGGGVLLGVALGAGRLGADVGGVITVGAGTAVAVALAAPGRLGGRRIAAVVLAPVAALAALAVLDLVTGGDSHFTRTVLRADDRTALEDVIARRYELAFNVLKKPAMLVLTPLSLAAIVWGARHRDRLLQGVPGAQRWAAALAGSVAAGIAGALFNDSGPLLLVFATFVTAWIAAYLQAAVRVRP